jgi:integrase
MLLFFVKNCNSLEYIMAYIETRTSKKGETSYRVLIRMKGQPAQSATFKRLTDAKAWARNTETAIAEGRYFSQSEAKKHTVAEMIDRYIKALERQKSKRLLDVKPMLLWWRNEVGDYSLSDLTRARLTQTIEKLLNKPIKRVDKETGVTYQDTISPARVNRYIFAMSKVCTVAVNEWEWLQENPFNKIKKFSEMRGRVRFLSDDEREKLLEACSSSSYKPLYLIVVLALSTGARKSEIMNLKWQDIDFDRRQFVLHETKNKERRVIPLTGHAYQMMLEHKQVQRIDTDFIFPSIKGDKPYEIKKPWLRAVKEATLKDFRFHDLRHSAASYLAMNGASLAEIAEVLGHKTLQMVKRYAHLSEAHTSAVVSRMNERIFGDG